jgi:predicted deacetylase
VGALAWLQSHPHEGGRDEKSLVEGFGSRKSGPRRAFSRSVAEFWARRWNAVVRTWLDRTAFRPLARNGWPRMGIFAAFALSAAIHAYLPLPALPLRYAGMMAAFFLLHGIVVLAERPLGVTGWPRWAGHAWTVAIFMATAPLFLEPVLVAFGMAGFEGRHAAG